MHSNIDFKNDLPKTYLDEFLNFYNSFYPIDIDYAKTIIKDTKKFYSAPKHESMPVYVSKLQNAWYKGIIDKNFDFSVYDDDYYFTDIFCCWDIYSRKYLNTLIKPNLLNLLYKTSIYEFIKDDVKTVVDLGNGLGFSTAYLKQIFKNADVYGTNLKNTKQWLITNELGKNYSYKMIEDEKNLSEIDFVFASEYYEHILDCVDDVINLINSSNPKIMYLGNSFNTQSVGHFTYYESKFLGKRIDQSKISRVFNNILREYGYENVKTKNWNNKPTLWIKKHG